MTPNPQDSAVALEVERAKFEAWADDQGFMLTRTVQGDGYQDLRTQGPWDAWQARASQSDGTSGGWQPIETAPKDGTGFLLTNGKDVSQGWWVHEEPYIREQRDVAGVYIDQQEHEGFDGWMDCDGGMQPDPTFWMHLPAAPNQGENHVG